MRLLSKGSTPMLFKSSRNKDIDILANTKNYRTIFIMLDQNSSVDNFLLFSRGSSAKQNKKVLLSTLKHRLTVYTNFLYYAI